MRKPYYCTPNSDFSNSCSGQWEEQYNYPESLTAGKGDFRVSYQSAKWPWIVSVKYHRIVGDQSGRDFSVVKFPESLGPGAYIVHYHWGGYAGKFVCLLVIGFFVYSSHSLSLSLSLSLSASDCIDVAVLPPHADGTPAVPDNDYSRFGYNSNVSQLMRVDHCQYTQYSMSQVRISFQPYSILFD